MKQVEKIQEQLKDKGYRKSSIREFVLGYMIEKDAPVSALELIEYLKTHNLNPNKTTVYREIDTLLKEQLVDEVDFLDGKKRYELNTGKDHHHHAVCTHCGKVECVQIQNDLERVEKQIEEVQNFKIKSHVLEFFGLCKKCQK